MPQVFQQTLWVGGTGEQGEGQEVVWPRREMRGRVRKGSALFRLGIRPRARRLSNAEGSREFKSPSPRQRVRISEADSRTMQKLPPLRGQCAAHRHRRVSPRISIFYVNY